MLGWVTVFVLAILARISDGLDRPRHPRPRRAPLAGEESAPPKEADRRPPLIEPADRSPFVQG